MDANRDGIFEPLREVERRADRLEGLAGRLAADHGAARAALDETRDFLDLAPRAQQLMEELAADLFGEILDEVEANLTHAVREILGQERSVRSERRVKGDRLHVEFYIEQDGKPEDILTGQGGSVCNILSTGLRLIALAQLDPAAHRPFLVLDEQDCWLRPELVPKFMKTVGSIARRLGLQALVISHHPVDLFAPHADRVYALRPSRDKGVVVEVLRETASSVATDSD